MKLSFGVKSIFLFLLSILFLILITLFESTLSGLSSGAERLLSMLLLVLPGVVGVIYGILGVTRKEPKLWVASLGVLLNGLFALFQLFVISFAG